MRLKCALLMTLISMSCASNVIAENFLFKHPIGGLKSSPIDQSNPTPDVPPEPEPNPITFSFSYTHNNSNHKTTNTVDTYPLAYDGDITTYTGYWNVWATGSIADVYSNLSEPFTGNLSLSIGTYVSSGYGNRADFRVYLIDKNGATTGIYSNTSHYAPSWTNLNFNNAVVDLKAIRLYIRDVGKGAPYVRFNEITLTK